MSADAGACRSCGATFAEAMVATGVLPIDTTGLPPGATFGAQALPSTAEASTGQLRSRLRIMPGAGLRQSLVRQYAATLPSG